MTHCSTRRTVLATGAAAFVAGCGNSGTSGSSPASPSAAASSPPVSSPPVTSSPSAASPAGSPRGNALAATGDIPLGGGRVFKEQKVVVTQPARNEFKAFSAICTHEGCTVSRVTAGTIDCPCHGSRFHIADGSVANGPAARPLPPKQITVEGSSIHLA
ncbi:Rieske (2Fe-2S) protein [Streptomyces sp. NPDC046197]|uniref:Rieske (2Fe-2S) protein n=1 Tax=Streptomyces sp. NPDC046197 TaxID=3154337 RepID=UPI00340FD220